MDNQKNHKNKAKNNTRENEEMRESNVGGWSTGGQSFTTSEGGSTVGSLKESAGGSIGSSVGSQTDSMGESQGGGWISSPTGYGYIYKKSEKQKRIEDD